MECKSCGDETGEVVTVEVAGKRRRVCEACAEAVVAEAEVLKEAESAMQGLMEYRGRS